LGIPREGYESDNQVPGFKKLSSMGENG